MFFRFLKTMVAIFFWGLHSTSFASDFNFTQPERALLKKFQDTCVNSVLPQSLFPDVFLNTELAISCEISSFFGQNKAHEILVQYLSAKSQSGESLLKQDYSYIWKTKADQSALSEKSRGTFKSLANGSLDYDLKIREVYSAVLETALLGDASAIYTMHLVSNVKDAKRLEASTLQKIGAHLGINLTNLLFLTPSELEEKYPTRASVEGLLNDIVAKSAFTSEIYLKAATKKFLGLMHKHKKYDDLVSIQLLKSSSNFRQNIIRVHLLTNTVPEILFSAALTIELNTKEQSALFSVGLENNMWKYRDENEILDLIGCLESFEEAALGLTQVGLMSSDALCIQNFQHKYNDIETLFEAYYPTVPFNRIRSFIFSEYEDWLIAGGGEDSFFKLLAFGDFRHILNRGGNFDFEGIDAHKFVAQNYDLISFTRPYKENQIFGDFAMNSERKTNTEFFQFFESYNFSSKILCKNISTRMCSKIARAVDLDVPASSDMKVDITVIEGERCKVSSNLEKTIKFFAPYNHSSSRFLMECTEDDFVRILEFPKSELLPRIIKFSGLPNLNTEMKILQNLNFYNNNFFGQINAHYNSGFEHTSKVVLPFQGLDYHKSNSKNLHLVDKAVLFSNPISEIDFDKISFENIPSLYGKGGFGFQPLFGLAKSYENSNSYESAFLSYHLSIVKDIHSKWGSPNEFLLMNKLASALSSAKNSGIPDNFLRSYASEAILAIKNAVGLTSIDDLTAEMNQSGYFFKKNYLSALNDAQEILYQYALGSSDEELSFFSGIYSPENYTRNYGKILSTTSVQIKNICSKYEASENLEKFLHSKESEVFFDTKMTSIALLEEHLMFLTRCRSESNWLSNLSSEKLNGEYKQLLIDMRNYMEKGFNPYNPKYLPLYEELANISSINLRPLGAIISLSINKYIASDLSQAFVMRDSSLLRNSQASMERIWTSLFEFRDQMDLEKKHGKDFATRFNYNLNTQSLNFHFPMATSKSRNRFVTGYGNGTELSFEYDNEQFQLLREYLDKQNQRISEAQDPLEYLTFRAQKSNHNYSFPVGSFTLANNFESFLSIKESDEILQGKLIVNLFYGNGRIAIQQSSARNKFAAGIVKIDEKSLSKLKRSIAEKNDFNEKDLDLGCEIFKPLHEFLNNTFKEIKSLELVVTVPSVNLLPIPSEVILGSYCSPDSWSIVHAGDILAAVEFLISAKEWKVPTHFVGVGNPTSRKRGVKLAINLGTSFRSGKSEEEVSLELKSLPPLIDAVKEIESISEQFTDSVNLLGTKASIIDGLLEVQKLSKEKETLLLLATHGIKPDYARDVSIPSLLSSREGNLELVESNLIDTFKLDNSIVFLSACDTAGGFIDRTDLYFTGFTTSFANAGAKLILSSLWPVYSDVSRKTTESFVSGWKETGIEGAIAFSKSSQNHSVKTLPFVFVYP